MLVHRSLLPKFLFLLALLLTTGRAMAQEMYAVFTNDGTLTFYYDNLRSTRTGDTYGMNSGYSTPGWINDHASEITKAVFDASFADARPTDTAWWFSNSCLKEIVGIEYLNTANVTDMRAMFHSCSGLTSLDVSNFNTENVTNMGSMFSRCSGLTSLDVSNFNTSNVTNMFDMFNSCSGLTSLDLSNFITANVTNMVWMFLNCSGLTSLDVSKFNTENVTDMSSMFEGCRSLTSLDVSNFNTANVTDMFDMFKGCSGLTSLDVSNFNTEKVTVMADMFKYCSGLTSLDVSNFNTTNATNMGGMFSGCSGLTSLDVSNFNTANVTDMGEMFSGCSGLTSLDVSNFNTTNVTDMSYMFGYCSGLTSLDVSNFNTTNVTDMGSMFSGCNNLKTINSGEGWTTEKVTESQYMFSGCSNLVGGAGTVFDSNHVDASYAHADRGTSNPGYLTDQESLTIPHAYAVYNEGTLTFYYDNLRSTRTGDMYGLNSGYSTPGWQNDHRKEITKAVFDASFADARPTSTAYWFAGSYNSPSLKEIIGMEYLNTEDVTNMDRMFYYCSSLTSLDVSNFNTANVTDMSNMFYNCSGLTSLDVSNFNTANVTNMGYMFSGCRGLTSLDVSNFNTSNVTNMGYMFSGCSGLTSLDVSNFNTENVTDMGGMFSGCYNLKTINSGEGWTTEKVTESQYMFSECSNLVGGAGTAFDYNHVDVSYAHADRGTSNPGYLTDPESLTVPQAYAVFNEGTLTFYYDNLRSTRTGDTYDLNTGYNYPYWQSAHSSEITKAVFDASFADARPTSTVFWFCYDSSLKEIVGLEYLNTENVTNMEQMFPGCSGLTSLDVSNFNTSNVTNMRSMFSGCDGLTSLDVSNFNTEKVTSMYMMFSFCNGLTSLNVSNFNTANVTDMRYMFSGCSGLTSLDVTNFNTANVTNMEDMFSYCSGITSLDVSNFNTSNVTNMSNMFSNCRGLTSLDVSNFNTSNVTDMYGMFSYCSSLESLNLSNFTIKNGTGINSMVDNMNISEVVLGSEIKVIPNFANCKSLVKVEVLSETPVSTTKYVFNSNTTGIGYLIVPKGCKSLYESAEGWKEFNTIFEQGDEIVDPSANLNVPYVNISNNIATLYYDNKRSSREGRNLLIEDGRSLFNGVTSFTKVIIDPSFAEYSPTSTANWFRGIEVQEIVGFENLNTSNVTDMSWMFSWSNFTSIDLSNFDTSNVTDMNYMFAYSNLKSLDLSCLNTSNVTYMYSMFYSCRNLTTLDVSNFNTSNVTSMADMFSGCSSLTSLDVSNFNTANVTNMYSMFANCSGLTSLDVSNFNTANVTEMYDMFSGCNGLTSISLGDGMVNMPDFSTCLDLMEVNAYSKEPQAFASNCFADNVKENATLNVYVGTKPVYESTGGWNEFKNIVEKFIIPHNEENVSYGNGGEIDESTDLNGNTIGNIYYNIGSDNGEYNSTEGCITLTKAVSDEEISALESENIFGDDFKNHYNGIVFMLQAGSGTIKVTAESVGNMTLKVKIGENEPITEELVGKTVSTFPYSVTEPTYVYIYGGASVSGASPMHRAGPAENALKIYGIEWTESDTPSAIGTVREAAPTEDTVIYSLDGQRLQQTRKGINIVNGKKVVIK